MPIGPGLGSAATLLFNHPTRGTIPGVNKLPISLNNDDEHYQALVKRQMKMIAIMMLPEIIYLFP